MNAPSRQRPLSVGPLRAFEAVARRLSFRAAAEELHLTQSAISRQIQSLEEEVGAVLFLRGTRHVELTADGALLLRAAAPALAQLDNGVRQIRQSRGRRVVSVTTFASFSSLWLIPRLEAYQRLHPDIDIRVSASDAIVDLEDGELDVALRYCAAERAGAGSLRLFGEVLTPAASPWLVEQAARGDSAPLRHAADLAQHALAEEDDYRPSAQVLSWRHWLAVHGQPGLQPRRWMYLNFTYQQVQAAIAGQALTLARMALVAESLARGELVEPFGPAGRLSVPLVYWLAVSRAGAQRPEVRQFADWVLSQAAETRRALGEADEGPAAAAGRPAA
ncbi:LysR substrate-binding domain-containing protein [Piscinibacter sakaiensis]|uniref:LysR family regulatory protein n=1 Tax=Piscinibacter sakaiensis TaxID=1547922 RepID=A0A0K8P4X5_PISS1|nr:LysR substrate-binding domain-containing protein [Piscinibacter sakaiensis]GAP37594.1 LysR family regulatory protein [Piscinibacter sakaiensis]